ncbi:MAG TPA: hypothetical protein VEL05_13200 [Candidatus Acidoferrum sp.]|nr:hypothetical protein [Candidatus Acidoferrum sp.]
MTLHVALAVSALAASAILVFAAVARPLAVVALLASGLEVAMALGYLRLHVAGIPLGLVLGLALAIPGLLAWLRAASKSAVSAAAIVAFAGVLQVFVSMQGRI